MTRNAKSSGGARRTRCRCGRPVYRQTVGPFDVTADAEALSLVDALQRTNPNRLAWCLFQRSEWTPQNLRSAQNGHPADCPHPHLVDHVCTGPSPAAAPAGRRTRKNTPAVHPGQQQLAL
ncbi:hypothetical protein [Streptomyces pseudovenezuelae]|uniref:hypothetical protein n=1 Tax=Streptomyces pseudovenezuelae TaxID=67350 RepID=UPI0036F096BE